MAAARCMALLPLQTAADCAVLLSGASYATLANTPLAACLRRVTGHKAADDASIGADSFFVVSPRLTAHANATHAAMLMAQHIAHHQQLGFSGHSVFLNRCCCDLFLFCCCYTRLKTATEFARDPDD